jgi:hypothetical protein
MKNNYFGVGALNPMPDHSIVFGMFAMTSFVMLLKP